MKDMLKLTKGFIRVFIVLFLILWVYDIVSLQIKINKSIDIIYDKLYRLEKTWSRMAGDIELFVFKSDAERIRIATKYYYEEVEPSIKCDFIDMGHLKEMYIMTATLREGESPRYGREVGTCPDFSIYLFTKIITSKYYEYIISNYLSNYFAFKTLASVIIAAGSTGCSMIIFLTIRWIYRGFKEGH